MNQVGTCHYVTGSGAIPEDVFERLTPERRRKILGYPAKDSEKGSTGEAVDDQADGF